MKPSWMYIGFAAVGKDENGKDYDASFMVSFRLGTVTESQVNYVVSGEIERFKEYHPSGQIKQQMQRAI